MRKNDIRRRCMVSAALFCTFFCSLSLAWSRYYLPHIADGTGAGWGYATRFTISAGPNCSGSLVFFSDTGAQMTLSITCPEVPALNGLRSAVQLSFSPSVGTISITARGSYPLRAGWAYIVSTEPLVSVDSGFSFYLDQPGYPIVWEAAVFSGEPSTMFDMEANVSKGEPWGVMDVNTGVALVNPHKKPIEVSLSLGSITPSIWKIITLPPSGHYAAFLPGIFPEVDFGTRYVNRVSLQSADHFFAMGMRVVSYGGNVFASTLPVMPARMRFSQQVVQAKPNDSYETATDISFNGTNQATVYGSFRPVDEGGERGSYSVSLPANAALSVRFVGGFFGSNAHCDSIELWKANGVLIKNGDILGGPLGNDAQLTYTTTEAGDYWIDVVGHKSQLTNVSTYWLLVRYE